jgi:hypothetical protein
MSRAGKTVRKNAFGARIQRFEAFFMGINNSDKMEILRVGSKVP